MRFQIYKSMSDFKKVRVRNNYNAYREVEADMLHEFYNSYGALPIFNRQFEYHEREHVYEKGFFNVLNPGSGKGFKWALTPLASNFCYASARKSGEE